MEDESWVGSLNRDNFSIVLSDIYEEKINQNIDFLKKIQIFNHMSILEIE